MEEEPDKYFASTSAEDCLGQVDMIFRSKDALSKIVYECSLSGRELLDWLPADFEIDLTKKFRRNKFGSYVAQYLAMRFLPNEGMELYLVQEKKNPQLMPVGEEMGEIPNATTSHSIPNEVSSAENRNSEEDQTMPAEDGDFQAQQNDQNILSEEFKGAELSPLSSGDLDLI